MKNDLKQDAPVALKLSEKQQSEVKRMNSKVWDHYSYRIGDYFLPYLINEDAGGFSNAEREELEEFEQFAQNLAIEDGWGIGHWTVQDTGEIYGKCEVTDKFGTLAEVWLMVYRDA